MQVRKFPKSRKMMMLFGDWGIISLSYILITFILQNNIADDMNVYLYSEMFICAFASTILFFYLNELYTIGNKRFADLFVDIILSFAGVMLIMGAFNHYALNNIYARRFIVYFAILSSIYTILWRYVMWKIEIKLHNKSKAVVMFGSEDECALVYKKLNDQSKFNLNMKLKYVCSRLGGVNWKNIIDRIDTVILCESIHQKEKIQVMNYCYQHNKDLLVLPSYYELFCSEADLSRLDDLPVLVPRPLHPSMEMRILKRTFDIIFSLIIIVATLPITLLCWLAVFLWEGRPVFDRKIMAGQYFKKIRMLQFRTTVFDSNNQVMKLTDTGRFLKWSHIDKIPGFWNVLKGDMSVVGPAADSLDLARSSEQNNPEYIYRMNVKPGMTGLAQVYGRECTDENDKLFYDLKYIQTISLREDLIIIIQTIRTLFSIVSFTSEPRKMKKFDFEDYAVLEKTTQEALMPQTPFSVLMSVYKKEKPEYFRMAVESVMNQSYIPAEVLIMQDGLLTDDLYDVCKELEGKYRGIIRFIQIKNNVGLGEALQRGVKECKYDLIARMDTDDIAKNERFELQVRQFEKHPELAICGGYIEEFNDSPNRIQTVRKVPLTEDDIYEYTKLRSPFNHMTVMFRRQAILEVGNYQPFLLLEDYYLWYRLVYRKYHTKNLPIVLVTARADDGMIARRGGMSYFMREVKLYHKFYKEKYISIREFYLAICSRFVGRICPGGMRRFLYQVFLR